MTAFIEKRRSSAETDIHVRLRLQGQGQSQIDTGIGFFDHMLTALARHAGWDLSVQAQGDLHVCGHHTVEDVGIVLGQALAEALGDKSGIARYGHALIPMDEALARAVVDVSGRPYLVFQAQFNAPMIGNFDTELCEEFFRALAFQAGLTLHLHALEGKNSHHIAEALFKALAHALAMALTPRQGLLSTKDTID